MTEKPPTILIAEDEPHIADLLQFMLRREGWTTILAPDGNQALELIRTAPRPNLVLLDLMLPFVDGFGLLSAIAERPDWQGVPVIMLTTKSSEKVIVRALDEGASDYIVKPFQPFELIARIKRLLGAAG